MSTSLSSGHVAQTNQVSQNSGNAKVLKDGSTVLVRVIADRGGGKYTGSVAGVRVNLTSSKNLQIGSSFLATITSKNGRIFVTPRQDTIVNQNIKIELIQNQQLISFLQGMGLPADSLSANLLQMTKQLEMKLDVALMNRLHNLSLKFKGKEKQSAELLMLLYKKGINADFNEMLQLLMLIDSGDERENDDFSEGKELANKINKIEDSWILFPFELRKMDDDSIQGRGCIRILLNNSKKIKMLNLDCCYDGKKYLFNLIYENSKCKKVKFNISNFSIDDLASKILSLKKSLAGIGSEIEVEWVEAEEIEGFASESEVFYGFDGRV